MKLALAAARATAFASRASGRGGGTTLPGRVLTALAPDAPRRLAARLPRGCVLVSATNGKTTTCALLAEVLRGRVQLARNSAGANLASGIASALAVREAATAELGLFECDEAALPAIAAQLAPERDRARQPLPRPARPLRRARARRRALARPDREPRRRRRRSSSPPTTRSPPRSSRSIRRVVRYGIDDPVGGARGRRRTPPTRASACAAGTPTTTARPTSGTSATTPARTAATHARRSTWPRARSTCAASTARPSTSAAATSACASSSRCPASTTSRTRSQRPLWRASLGEPLDVIAEGLGALPRRVRALPAAARGQPPSSCCC